MVTVHRARLDLRSTALPTNPRPTIISLDDDHTVPVEGESVIPARKRKHCTACGPCFWWPVGGGNPPVLSVEPKYQTGCPIEALGMTDGPLTKNRHRVEADPCFH